MPLGERKIRLNLSNWSYLKSGALSKAETMAYSVCKLLFSIQLKKNFSNDCNTHFDLTRKIVYKMNENIL